MKKTIKNQEAAIKKLESLNKNTSNFLKDLKELQKKF